MASKPEQLAFDLPVRRAVGRSAFFVSEANATALALLDQGGWPQARLLLTGPVGAGKTHLASVWAGETGAVWTDAAELGAALPGFVETPPKALVVEDIDRIAGSPDAQEALFHLLNAQKDSGFPLLMTATTAPALAGYTLPDLVSRLTAAMSVPLSPPDDALRAAILVKLFNDRQVEVPPNLIAYLVRHTERSFAGLGELVAKLDAAALAERRPITRDFARRVLDIGGDRSAE